jgi:hypothetical protein
MNSNENPETTTADASVTAANEPAGSTAALAQVEVTPASTSTEVQSESSKREERLLRDLVLTRIAAVMAISAASMTAIGSLHREMGPAADAHANAAAPERQPVFVYKNVLDYCLQTEIYEIDLYVSSAEESAEAKRYIDGLSVIYPDLDVIIKPATGTIHDTEVINGRLQLAWPTAAKHDFIFFAPKTERIPDNFGQKAPPLKVFNTKDETEL